jgi:hypothetical protein
VASIYTEFATLPTEIEDFSVGGPVFAGVRATPGTISTLPTFAAVTAARMVVVAQALEGFARTFPEVEIWKAPWLVFALLGVDIQVGDYWKDSAVAYLITATPITHYGFILAPAASVDLAQVPTVTAGALAGQPMGLLLSLTYAA